MGQAPPELHDRLDRICVVADDIGGSDVEKI